MKYSKAAAVVVGSLVALGAASVATTAQAAEPVPGGGVSGSHGTQPASNVPNTPSTPNAPSDPVTTLTGTKLPVGTLARQAGALLGKTPTAGLGKGVGGAGLDGLPVG